MIFDLHSNRQWNRGMSPILKKLTWLASLCTVAALCMDLQKACADDLPPKEVLDAIFPDAATPQKPEPSIEISFERTDAGIDVGCGLQPVSLVETRAEEKRRFHLLVDPVRSTPIEPREFFAKLNRLTVDIDGSGRAYHPEDPNGTGVCVEQKEHRATSLRGVCALAPLSSAEVRIYRGDRQVRPFENGKRNPDFAATWSDLWLAIKSRQLNRIDLKGTLGDAEAEKEALFYSREKNAAVVFDTEIIPFRDGYPCQHEDDAYRGYFVAATTLRQSRTGVARKANVCDGSRFLDALHVPFVVIPEKVFKNISVGDVAIGYAKIGQTDRMVFGIVGDTGPVGQIGEASIAFVNKLLNQSQEPMNSGAVNKLDIDLEKREAEYRDISSMAVLVIGNTSQLLNGNYSPANIERVGKKALAKWSARSGRRRLLSCVNSATANPLKGAVN